MKPDVYPSPGPNKPADAAVRRDIRSRCAHGGPGGPTASAANRPFVPAIAQSTLFDLGSVEEAEAIFSGARSGFAYTRFGNPTVEALASAIADLEEGADAMVTASGNAATLCTITAAMDGRTGPLVTHQDVYGGTFELLGVLSRVYRVPVEFVDAADLEAWRTAIAQAGAVLVETPSNPLLRLIDLRETVECAHAVGAPVIVDNTVATPFNQRPFAFGADWIVYSTSKYLNGHSDMIGGCVVRREPLSPVHRAIHKNLGGTVNAFEAWLVLRGLRTFALRMAAHNHNGLAVAQWLQRRPEVAQVHFPGLSDHPQAALFRQQMTSGGALLSFELAGGEGAARRFLNRLGLIVHAVSLGGMESLATCPAMSSHRGMTPEARQRAGVTDGLIRLSVGVEALDDILADLDQALRDDSQASAR